MAKRQAFNLGQKQDFVQKIDKYIAKHPEVSIEAACEKVGNGIGWWAYYRYKNDLKKAGLKAKHNDSEVVKEVKKEAEPATVIPVDSSFKPIDSGVTSIASVLSGSEEKNDDPISKKVTTIEGKEVDDYITMTIRVKKSTVYEPLQKEANEYVLSPEDLAQIYLANSVKKAMAKAVVPVSP